MGRIERRLALLEAIKSEEGKNDFNYIMEVVNLAEQILENDRYRKAVEEAMAMIALETA